MPWEHHALHRNWNLFVSRYGIFTTRMLQLKKSTMMKYFYENYRVNMRIDTLAKCKPTYHLHLHKIYQIRVNVQKCLLPYTYIRYKILRSLQITNMINTTNIEYYPIRIVNKIAIWRNNIFSSKLHSNYDIARKPYCPKTFLTCKTLRQRKSNLRSLDF